MRKLSRNPEHMSVNVVKVSVKSAAMVSHWETRCAGEMVSMISCCRKMHNGRIADLGTRQMHYARSFASGITSTPY